MVVGIRTTVDSIVGMVGLLVRGGVRIICVGSARMREASDVVDEGCAGGVLFWCGVGFRRYGKDAVA